MKKTFSSILLLGSTIVSFFAITSCDGISSSSAKISSAADSLSLVQGQLTGLSIAQNPMLTPDEEMNREEFIKGFEAGKKYSASYIAGLQFSQQIKNFAKQDSTMSLDAFIQGLKDKINTPNDSTIQDKLSEAQAIYERLNAQIEKAKHTEQIAADSTFMVENAKKDSVQVTASGLQYKIVTLGTGEVPAPEDTVVVHYTGTTLDGVKFDSSYDRGEPTSFALNQVIKGWTEGLQLVPAGSKIILWIPQELAYGAQAMGNIKPFSALKFECELISVKKAEQK